MVSDEAPAATVVVQRVWIWPRGNRMISGCGPTSLVAAESVLDEAGRHPCRWLHCNIQVVCQRGVLRKDNNIKRLQWTTEPGGSNKSVLSADSQAQSLKTSPGLRLPKYHAVPRFQRLMSKPVK